MSYKRYDWKNVETGEVVEHTHWSTPPDLPGKWVRSYTLFGVKVQGGASPSNTSLDRKSLRDKGVEKKGKRATIG